MKLLSLLIQFFQGLACGDRVVRILLLGRASAEKRTSRLGSYSEGSGLGP